MLLGDPPIDWSRVRTSDDVLPFDDRDGHAVSVLEREVLSRGRRAPVCYGSNHVMHWGGGAIVGGRHPQPCIRGRAWCGPDGDGAVMSLRHDRTRRGTGRLWR